MTDAILGLIIGLPVMWLYSRLADLANLSMIKSQKRELMRKALSHTGRFDELLSMQKQIITLSLKHLQKVCLPALISASPLVLFLVLRPEYATFAFGGGVVGAFLIAKWRWGI